MDQIQSGDVPIWTSNKAQKKTPARARQTRGRGKAKAKKVARALVPDFVAPELATLDTEVPTGPNWLHEIKYDGYRIIGRKAGDDITLFSRSGLDWTVRFPAIAKALLTFPATSALLDGEIAFVLPSGVTDFKSLQEHIDSPHGSIRYFVFDLLSLDGKDWRKKTLKERRAKLAKPDGGEGRLQLSRLCRLRGGLGARSSSPKPARRGSKASCRSAPTGLTSRAAARTGSRSNASAARNSSSAAIAAPM